MSEVTLYSFFVCFGGPLSCASSVNSLFLFLLGVTVGISARVGWKVSSQLLLSGWMYIRGLSEGIYFAQLIPLHPSVLSAPRYSQ